MGQSAQTVHMLTKPQVFYDNNLKQALGFQNSFYLKKAQQIRPMLYDSNVIGKETNVISNADSKETLMLEEEYFDKSFVPQQELPDEQALHPNTDQSASSPVKIKAPRELPKVSLVNTSLKKLKYHLGQFDNVVQKRITPNALTEGEWGVELNEAYAVSLFIGGFKKEISMPIRLFKITSLTDVYAMAKMQEATNVVLKPRYNSPLLPTPKFVTNTVYANKTVNTPFKSNTVNGGNQFVSRNGGNRPYRLTQKELEDKRAKNQCFYCEQKYFHGHKCSGQLNSLEVVSENHEELVTEGDNGTFEDCVEEEMMMESSPQISLNALSCLNSFQTMRVKGLFGKNTSHILLDCGSTHNFLDLKTAKNLGCQFESTTPLQVSVANGQHMMTCYKSTLGDIQCNFKNLTMKFEYKGRRMVLRGTKNTSIHWMQGKSATKSGQIKQAELASMVLCVYPVSLWQMNEVTSFDQEVGKVLAKVFEILTKLPPQRSHDHQISLVPNTPPINIRPYRHPPNQKDVIKLMVKELLESRVIRTSQSPFSSHIVMVKKKDGSWRMCVDYRQLNKYTVKDKFPIPMIEELIDELNGSAVFSKLDLRSGYQQIRMSEADICKTTFRTHRGNYEFLVMPFGLTNAPLTFQSLMNTMFKPFLRKFMLVFFDDIMIYSKTKEEHCKHLAMVLQVMQNNTLFAKRSKCFFAVSQVEYLGHIISAQGVSTDPSKIKAMQKWPTPATLKQLRGFLGLTGYYRRFIKNYASISQPLTALLKKNAFKWNVAAELAYNQLKKAMIEAPMLALPNFDQEFVVETDANGTGIGNVLCKNGHPIAHLSKTLAAKHQSLSTYEKKILPVVAALDKWKGYLLDRHFKIITDHFSLKYLLNQKLTTPFQLKWLPKLLGYDYEISYKKGMADALSRVNQSGELLQITVLWRIIVTKAISIVGLMVKRKGKVVVGNDLELRKELIKYEAIGGHSGVHRQKPDLSAYPGLIQPLPIPERVWTEVTMDFIEKLPVSNGKSVIMMVVERLTKYAHFMALSHPFSASQVAQMFMDNVYKLHGLPESIVSDRDKVFMSGFWKALFTEMKVKLKFSTAYHPQTDGQTKVVSIRQGQQHKLSSKYHRPFKVEERIGEVAYKLQLPMLPQMVEDGTLAHKPMAILERRLGKLNNKPVLYVLTQWVNRPIEEATWEVYGDLIMRFHEFDTSP
ncbi:putative mitochondrial protein [Tanacetum coccineum]